ncbi:integrating conjugative element protein [Pseudomonas sp. PA15(2017)]|uniref:TIGR03759 family integrating conjugative element protein n=1 Tax=Pseudomonas sp. PA15(2017) TaxID=1932111 RepID=UPI00096248CE|nr:TIGR03759 family integrating conjugative element protein [Pseudomonas sp. PA15(2017)]OLU25500.1 integrating conjugative element protein [Pseudomonas sp. PA15(2017)]
MPRTVLRIALMLPALIVGNAIADSTKPEVTKIESTSQEAATAKAWNLDESEWRQYKQIQAGPRGIWSPGLDPITSLGLNAETDAQRRRYAELLVRIEKQRVEQELAFQREYDAAWIRLYPDLLPIASSTTNLTQPIQPDMTTGRLLVFVSPSCSSCEEAVATLLTAGTDFDLFIVGTSNDDQVIRRWAQDAGIPPEQVRSRQITLNHDNGQWLDLGGLTGSLPAAFKRAGDKWLPVDL